MKTITFAEIDDYLIINSIENAPLDPAETEKKVEIIIMENPGILLNKTKDELLIENAVPSRLGQGQQNVDDAAGQNMKNLLDTLGPHEKLLLSGGKIAGWRGTEYWIAEAGVWKKRKIELLEETLPDGAVLPEEITPLQQKQIAEQAEAERLASLSPEQKAAEKEGALASARREVRILKEEADIAAEPFDARAEYQSRKKKIEEKYA